MIDTLKINLAVLEAQRAARILEIELQRENYDLAHDQLVTIGRELSFIKRLTENDLEQIARERK